MWTVDEQLFRPNLEVIFYTDRLLLARLLRCSTAECRCGKGQRSALHKIYLCAHVGTACGRKNDEVRRIVILSLSMGMVFLRMLFHFCLRGPCHVCSDVVK